jgi:hypothetical protein
MMKTGRSGSISSMWNKNLCKPYSRMVHMRFPVKKHRRVLTSACVGMLDSDDKGRAGFTVKAGRAPENWKRARRKR